MLLLDKGRIGALPDIARAYHTLVDEHAGRVRATVTSARPLDPALEKRLKTALEKQSGKTVILEKREDPAILGGAGHAARRPGVRRQRAHAARSCASSSCRRAD